MHDERLWGLRQNRYLAAHGLEEWEELRELASRIKQHTLSHLDQYLEEFEANATAHGVHVHWAEDGAEHNRIVHGVLADRGAKTLIKSIPTGVMVASVLVAKYAWRLPLYRQSQMLAAQGLDITRSVRAFWVGYAAAELEPL